MQDSAALSSSAPETMQSLEPSGLNLIPVPFVITVAASDESPKMIILFEFS